MGRIKSKETWQEGKQGIFFDLDIEWKKKPKTWQITT